jgi:hypothetical protein
VSGMNSAARPRSQSIGSLIGDVIRMCRSSGCAAHQDVPLTR